jgi:hypothetical protein
MKVHSRKYVIRTQPKTQWPREFQYYFFFSNFLMEWGWIHLVLRPLFGILHQPQITDDDVCGAIGVMRIGRGNRITRRKHTPVPLCPPQIPHDLTRARIRAAAMGSRRLTAWALTRPNEQGNTKRFHESFYFRTPLYFKKLSNYKPFLSAQMYTVRFVRYIRVPYNDGLRLKIRGEWPWRMICNMWSRK